MRRAGDSFEEGGITDVSALQEMGSVFLQFILACWRQPWSDVNGQNVDCTIKTATDTLGCTRKAQTGILGQKLIRCQVKDGVTQTQHNRYVYVFGQIQCTYFTFPRDYS